MKHAAYNGEPLRERRLSMGLTPSAVYRQIHIPAAYLDALERGDFSLLPSPCYAAGFLKTYCRFLEMDPQPFLDAFRETINPPIHGVFRRPRIQLHALLSSTWGSELLTWATVCAILALGWFAYNAVFDPQADVADKLVEAGTIDEMVVPPTPDH